MILDGKGTKADGATKCIVGGMNGLLFRVFKGFNVWLFLSHTLDCKGSVSYGTFS